MFIRTIVTAFVCVCFYFSTTLFAAAPQEQKLILNMQDIKELPRNYRKAQSVFKDQDIFESTYLPSREGLDDLRLSGSSQFSKAALEALIEDIGDQNLYIINLRQESHGFINNHAASWFAPRDWGNVGLSPEEIEIDEREKLNQVASEGVVILYDKHTNEPMVLDVENVDVEESIVREKKLKYKRFYVTDHVRPTDEIVDEFIAFTHTLPENAWLHFHCLAGKGRTTTFMIMYDVMKNGDKVSFEDILIRQWLIGGLKLDQEYPPGTWKIDYLIERLTFLRKFYDYCKEHPTYDVTWQEYNQA